MRIAEVAEEAGGDHHRRATSQIVLLFRPAIRHNLQRHLDETQLEFGVVVLQCIWSRYQGKKPQSDMAEAVTNQLLSSFHYCDSHIELTTTPARDASRSKTLSVSAT